RCTAPPWRARFHASTRKGSHIMTMCSSSHPRHRRTAAALALAAIAGLSAGGAAQEKSRPLQATLEILRPFTYQGEPPLVRVAVFNTSEQPYDNAAGINLLGGLRVVSPSRGQLSFKAKPEIDAKKQPAVIPAGGFFGTIQDISSIVPDISRADKYTITW